MNNREHLTQLFQMSDDAFANYRSAVEQIAALRRTFDVPVGPRRKPELPVVAPEDSCLLKKSRLPKRRPMRAPKPDSLRGVIHAVLKDSSMPLRRPAIIDAVARARGANVDDALTGKIGDLLTNPHDPAIRRVSRGVYTYAADE